SSGRSGCSKHACFAGYPLSTILGRAIRRECDGWSSGATRCSRTLAAVGSHGDDHLSSSVSGFDVGERRGGPLQRVFPVDDRLELSGFDELLEGDKVPVVRDRKVAAQVLPHEG